MSGLSSEGQPDSIVMEIENMVRSFIEKVRYFLSVCFLLRFKNTCKLLHKLQYPLKFKKVMQRVLLHHHKKGQILTVRNNFYVAPWYY